LPGFVDEIPLLIEKPPGLTVEETDQMISAARSSGTPNQVSFNRRYTPLVVYLKKKLQDELACSDIQHLQYDFYRIGRTDADFSTTAIMGLTRRVIWLAVTTPVFHSITVSFLPWVRLPPIS